MGKNKRKRYQAEFKARVALEAIRGEQTVAEIAARHSIHPNMVAQWKKQAVEGMARIFTCSQEHNEAAEEARLKDLHAKIGQLTVERDFLAKAFGR